MVARFDKEYESVFHSVNSDLRLAVDRIPLGAFIMVYSGCQSYHLHVCFQLFCGLLMQKRLLIDLIDSKLLSQSILLHLKVYHITLEGLNELCKKTRRVHSFFKFKMDLQN